MNKEYINKIIQIGKKELCTDEELSYFLPNLPDVANKDLLYFLNREYGMSTFHMTRRDILAIKPKTRAGTLTEKDETLVSFIIDLVKGIHLIEFISGYGGSSTTTICNLFGTLVEKDAYRAIDLYNWIANHGGNYYIEPNITFEEAVNVKNSSKKS